MTTALPTHARLLRALIDAAADWREPDYEPRAEAVEATLEAPNRFTEEAVAYAINQQMDQLRRKRLERWLDGRRAQEALTVGVLNAGNVPLAGLQDLLAVLLAGHRYRGTVSSKSPALLPAFAADVQRRCAEAEVRFVETETLFEEADVVIATGSDETRDWARAQCEAHGIPEARRLLRGHRFSVAVVDGQETDDEWEGLAEDALLHEGAGCRNVALIWAPEGLAPDAYLDALASFRGVFPAHTDTPGTLKMQQAFLHAVEQPHAYGEGLEFLMSKGEPDVQGPGHIRWVPYADLEAVRTWLREHADALQVVVARDALRRALPAVAERCAPGEAQRPALDWQPDGVDPLTFLTRL